MDIAQILGGQAASSVITCGPDMMVRDVIALLAEKRIGALPVVDGDKVVGIFSERDVIYSLANKGEICLSCRVSEAMTAPPITVSPTTDVLEALGLMTRRRIRHLPVVDGEAMVGFISIGDLVKTRIDTIQQEANSLREYIQTA